MTTEHDQAAEAPADAPEAPEAAATAGEQLLAAAAAAPAGGDASPAPSAEAEAEAGPEQPEDAGAVPPAAGDGDGQEALPEAAAADTPAAGAPDAAGDAARAPRRFRTFEEMTLHYHPEMRYLFDADARPRLPTSAELAAYSARATDPDWAALYAPGLPQNLSAPLHAALETAGAAGVNGTVSETVAVAVCVLAASPWALITTMLVTGRWKIVTPTRPVAEPVKLIQVIPAPPAVPGGDA